MSEYSPAVRVALADFVADLQLEQRHTTARNYARTLAPLLRLELSSVALLTPTVCRELMVERAGVLQASSLGTFYAVLRSFCRFCVDRRYLQANPTDGIPKPRQRRPLHRWLNVEQLGAMYRACRTDADRLIMLLCGGSGLRAQELLTLKWSGVDFDRGEIRVLGKGKKWRTLAPGEMAMGVLQRAKTQCRSAPIASPLSTPAGTGPVYVMPYRTTDNLGYHVDQLAKRAGVPRCHPHLLRHSFAVAWLRRTDDAFTLQTLLGHSSPQMVGYYVRDVREEAGIRKQAAVDLAGGLFGAGNP